MIDDLLSYLDHDRALRELDPESDEADLKLTVMEALRPRLTPQEWSIACEVVGLRTTTHRLGRALSKLRQQNEEQATLLQQLSGEVKP